MGVGVDSVVFSAVAPRLFRDYVLYSIGFIEIRASLLKYLEQLYSAFDCGVASAVLL